MIRLKEIVPFSKTSDVEKGLRQKYSNLDEDTFGVDMEFHTNNPDNPEPDDPHDYIEKAEMEAVNDSNKMSDYEGWLGDLRQWQNRNRGSHNWNNSYGPIDVDTWEGDNPEPAPEDFETDEEYDKAYDSWYSQRKDVEWEYNKWERNDKLDYIRNWIEGMINDGTFNEYFDIESSYQEPEYREEAESEISDFIEDLTGQEFEDTGWDVGQDAGDEVEIRTPPMKYTDENLDLLDEVMTFCNRSFWAAGDASAHVHIGLSRDTTIFDLLAATTLVDEKAVKADITPDRELEQFAALSDVVHKKIITAIKEHLDKTGERKIKDMAGKFFVIGNKDLEKSIRSIMGKFHGVNVLSYFTNKTLEFRYFSSQIAPYPGKFESWIKYFMLIPRVARSRDQFIVGKDEEFPIVFTRKSKSETQITILDKTGKMPKKTGFPSDKLPDTTVPDKEERKVLAMLKKKMRNPDQKEFSFSKIP